jgi:hypothetical protein
VTRSSSLWLLLLAGTLVVPLWPSWAEAQGTEPFSASETRRLRRGRLVSRPETRRRGDLLLVGGTSFQIIDQPVDVVWAAVKDSRAYTHYLPEVHRVRTVARGRNGRGRVIEVLHKRGPLEASYHLRLDFSDNLHTAQFRIDPTRDGDVREGWGYIQVQAYGESRSMVTWAVLADVGSGLAVGLLRGEIQDWILKVPFLMKRYLGWAADRYRD